MSNLPISIQDETQLDQMLSDPSPAAIEAIRQLKGDVMLLGAGGKMGPSLARMVRRASELTGGDRRVIAVSRFSDASLPASLQANNIETISGDLLNDAFLKDLPDIPHIVFMTGAKFGTSQDASRTWAMNVLLPARACERFRDSRVLGFSTGNVYPFVPIKSGGCVESDELNPVGEYAMSALGRERMFQYASLNYATPMTIARLNYAVEMRYGVVVDLAKQVWDEQVIDLSMGFANVIWQADANAMCLAALADASAPPFVVNVAGPELLDVRTTCERFSELFGKPVQFRGQPASTALLNNAAIAYSRYGRPRVGLDQIIDWTADWLLRGQRVLRKPTHFEVRTGKF